MSATACPEFGAALPSPCSTGLVSPSPWHRRWGLPAVLRALRQLALRYRRRRQTAVTQAVLATLDARTLRDIGLGEWAAASGDRQGGCDAFWTTSGRTPY
jgi:uncharacterized protein YjiS (DUF1127 family)